MSVLELKVRFLLETAEVLSSSSNRQAVLRGFAQAAIRHLCDGCGVALLEGENLRLGAVAYRDAAARLEIESREGILHQALRTGRPIVCESSMVVAAPMMVARQTIGVLCLISSDDSRRFGPDDLEVATAAASGLAITLENIRFFERFRLLGRATDQLFARGSTSEKLHKLLEVIVDEIADWAVVYALGPARSVRVQDVLHRDPEMSRTLSEIRGQRVLTPEAERNLFEMLTTRRSLLCSKGGAELLRDSLRSYIVPVYAQVMPQSSLTVALFTSDEVYGALTIYAERHSLSERELELMQELARRVALSFEHDESVERERRLTQTLQEVTLPAMLPEIANTVVSTVYTPAATTDAQLGGDWYDIFELRDGRYLLSIGDVTGRGLHASAIMGKLRHSINVVALYELNPVSILDAAEFVVRQRYPDAIATAFVAIYDPHDRSIVYANAGHPYPILRLRGGALEELTAEGLPIGLRSMDKPAQPYARTMRDVEVMVFYTDGVTEANRDTEIGERCLRTAVESAALPFVRNAAELIAALCLPPQAHDDAAIMTVTFPHPATWMFQADHARAAPDARCALVTQLRREGIDREDVDVAEVIFGELVANVVRHAPGPIDVALEWRNGNAILHVTDRGRGFMRSPLEAQNPLRESGRGLWLVEQFGGAIEVERLEGYGTHVSVTLPVRRAAPRASVLAKR